MTISKGFHTKNPLNTNINGNGTVDNNGSLNGNHEEPKSRDCVAICGLACRLPGGIHCPQALWEFLLAKGDARDAVPESRYKASAHYSAQSKPGCINSEQGYFLDESVKLASLDTTFFSMSKTELEQMDPQHRQLLEVARECIDDAGEVNWRGSKTGVYAGSFGEDWAEMFTKDSQQYGGSRSTATSDMALSNRVSYEMDLRGPSVTIRTGCSASLICLNEACAAIAKGDCNAAIVGGTSLLLAPGLTATMAKQGVLSPSGSCKTFSDDADGYAQAEGVVAIYIKSLKDALRDGNPVRAIIRGISTNHGGKSAGMTHPSSDAQEALIRRTYHTAGIRDFSQTAFIETHGTGTPTGDPIEAIAIARVFGDSGIYMGSLKPNLGHSEGASGLASLIKCVLAMENNTIPPNIKFSKPNRNIPFESGNLVVPTEPISWPTSRLKRVSLNSFGLGGSNAHVIIESPPSFELPEPSGDIIPGTHSPKQHLLLYSANSSDSLKQMTESYNSYLHSNPRNIADLAYTLANGREHMPHRTYVVASRGGAITPSPLSKVSSSSMNLVMAFTGQGAQWPQMGRDLLEWNSTFRASIRFMDRFMRSHALSAPSWSLEAELCRPPINTRLYEAAIAHPTLTAIQIALVDTLASFGIKPSAVVGHSGGEVAAAYAAGALTANEAIAVSLNRGLSVMKQTKKGAMAAIGMGKQDTLHYLLPNVNIACENSPSSVTISGDEDQVKAVIAAIQASQPNILTKVLNVDKAYHSPHMVEVGDSYLDLLAGIVVPRPLDKPFFSSVTGKLFQPGDMLHPKYWQENLESPVLFHSAVKCLLAHPLGNNPIFLEVGPHSALKGPLRQILAQGSSTAPYASLMLRGEDCVASFLAAIGKLFTLDVAMDFRALAPGSHFLLGLPPYPWHHPSDYWHELRSVREWRFRQYAYHDLLGVKVTESTDFEPAWKNLLHLDNAPWLRDHVINENIIFPLAGYIGLAGEAIRQIAGAEDGFRLRRVHVTTALVLHEGEPTELITTFRRQRLTNVLEGEWWEFTVTSHNGHAWMRHCHGEIAKLPENQGLREKQPILPRKASSHKWYEAMRKEGFYYGPHFQSMADIRTATAGAPMASATILNHKLGDNDKYHIHPTVIDSVLQLLFCAETHGLCRKYRKLLPTVIESMSISRCSQNVDALVTTSQTPGSGIIGKGVCVADDNVVVQMTGLCLSPLDDAYRGRHGDGHAAARHTWGPHIDFMNRRSLIKPSSDRANCTPLLNELTQLCVIQTQRSIAGLESKLPSKLAFRAWIDHQLQKSEYLPMHSLDDATIETQIDKCVIELEHTPAAAVALALRKLTTSMQEIFVGKVYPLDIIQEDDLIGQIKCFSEACDKSLFFKHLTHTKPNLRILEIAAGTGTCSKINLAHLGSFNTEYLMYSQYTVSDTSLESLSTAKETLESFPNVDFLHLDINRDPREQDIDYRKYDLILATNIFQSNPEPQKTLTHLRTFLADNGQLLLHESCLLSPWESYLWGSLSETRGALDGRADEPNITLDRWNRDLPPSGLKLLKDDIFDANEPSHMNSVILATPSVDYRRTRNLTLLCGSQDYNPALLIEKLVAKGFLVSRYNLGDILPVGQDVIVALDETEPFFHNITPTSFEQFKKVLASLGGSRIMWLTRMCHMDCQDPRYAQVIGVARTIRSEMLINFATCETRDIDIDSELIADIFIKFLQSQQTQDKLGPDFEFTIYDGTVHVGRFYPFSVSDALLTEHTSEELELKFTRSGRRGTVQWSPKPTSIPLGNQVEVATHAVGLNFVDVLTRMGIVELSEPTFGHEASGVVRAVGPHVTDLRVGDRVMLAGRSTFSTSIVISELLCAKIPDEMSFVEAATMPIVYGTAMQALMTVGRLEKGQSVLIHSGCGGVGLAAIQLAQMIEADIFVTVSTEEKVRYLVEQLHIPRERIFNSRNNSFVGGIMQVTQGRGVDLALNSLSGDLLHETWRCIAEFGTMLEIGKRDLIGAGKLDMDVFLANRSYSCVDLDQMCAQKPLAISRLLKSIVQLYSHAKILPISPVHVFRPNEIQDAFTFMQPGSHIGKVVVEFTQPFLPPSPNHDMQISRIPTQVKFDESASYLLVGGLGGLGRAIAIWMVEHGARHLVFLSPSAGASVKHMDLTGELESMSCSVKLVRGSVTNPKDVREAFSVATASGPVKGVFQMSMVLRDQALSGMSLNDWNSVTAPKIQGTWNLHSELDSMGESVDFFVLFSSITGLIGQPGQANYSSANTFLDAFVNYRTRLGLPISAINLGSVFDVGFVAENDEIRRKFTAMNLHQVSEQSLLDAVTLAIISGKEKRQEQQPQTGFVNYRSFVLGLGSTVPIATDSNVTLWKDLRMATYHNNMGDNSAEAALSSSDLLSKFLTTAKTNSSILSAPETNTFLATEIGKKLFGLLLKSGDEVDTQLSLAALGMDSLVAIEMRAWWRHTFGFDVTVLEMLQMGTLDALGKYAADRLCQA